MEHRRDDGYVVSDDPGRLDLALVHRWLCAISKRLGYNWSSNGDFLTPAVYPDREPNPTQGPTITCAIDFLDGSRNGHVFWIEDGGFPNLLANLAATASVTHPTAQVLLSWIREQLQTHRFHTGSTGSGNLRMPGPEVFDPLCSNSLQTHTLSPDQRVCGSEWRIALG